MGFVGEQPIAIELELEDPAIARERVVRRLGEHDIDRRRIDACTRRDGFAEGLAQPAPPGAARFEFFDSQPGQPRRFRKFIAWLLHPRVALLDEQPVLLGLLHLHERPLAVELVASELEQELPFLEPFARVLEGYPFAAVPHDY